MNSLKKIARDYLDAWSRKDLAGIASHLDPKVTFRGPVSELEGRDQFLAGAERMFALLKSVEPRTVLEEGGQVACLYDFNCIEPVGRCRTAEFLTFEGDKIASSEVFFDSAPFAKLHG
jgi:ketosteroid isomerase-like protein